MNDFQTPVEMFNQRRAALDPIPVVTIGDAVNVADFRVMDMSANHAIDVAAFGNIGQCIFEIGNELDRVLDF